MAIDAEDAALFMEFVQGVGIIYRGYRPAWKRGT
jgi:hypothetical protein